MNPFTLQLQDLPQVNEQAFEETKDTELIIEDLGRNTAVNDFLSDDGGQEEINDGLGGAGNQFESEDLLDSIMTRGSNK